MARIDNLKNFLTDIADKFRSVLGTTDAISHAEYDTKIDEVYDAGKRAWWDLYQPEKSELANHDRRFAGAGWKNTTWTPIHDMNVSSAQYMFWAAQVTDIQEYLDETGVVLNFEPCSNFTQVFSYCRVKWLKKFGSSTKKGTYTSTFDNATNLHTIEEFYVAEDSTFSNTFNYCSALVNLTFIGTISKNGVNLKWSTKLSKASHINIFSTLSTTTSGLTVTLSKTAVNNAFGINVDDPTTYPEGSEWYELRHSRDNWTVNFA